MKECNEQSKVIRVQLAKDYSEKIPYTEYLIPVHREVIKYKSINTLIREIDAQEHEVIYLKSKIPEYWNWIDLEARNTFHEGIGAGILKCVIGYNHHKSRNKKINQGVVSNRCPRCNQRESREYVILCKGIEAMKLDYITKLEEKIKKVKHTDHIQD